MKLAMVCRFDNSGLGTLSWEFFRHLKPAKVLLVENGVFQTFPERYKDAQTRRVDKHSGVSKEDRDWLLDGMDAVFSCETFYSYELIQEARRKGVKSVLYTMFEMYPSNPATKPDHFLCPSTLDYKVMPEPKTYLPVPIATDRLYWNKRTTANVFIHTASHGGMNGRKGTALVVEAMKYVTKDVKMVINSWSPLHVDNPKIEVRNVNFQNYWQVWREGDVLVYPQDYNGICLPVTEAFASGLALVTTNIEPFNEWLPKRCLFDVVEMYRTQAARGLMMVDAARIDPKLIAQKIDEIAGTDISSISLEGRVYARKHSWDALLPAYNQFFESICQRSS